MEKRIKLHLDGQVLSETEKTGIGWCVYNLTERLTEMPDADIVINYFSRGHSREQTEMVYAFEKKGACVREIKHIKSWVYKMHSLFIPIPWKKLFGEADVSLFMNYYVPPCASGKRVSIVYDMVARKYPETMDMRTRILLGTTLGRSIKRADRIVTISEAAKRDIMEYYKVDSERIAVMPMGVESSVFRPSEREKTDAAKEKYGISGDYFMYLGTLEPRKNVEQLIEAYALVKKSAEHSPVLVISGRKGWQYDAIFARVEELGLGDSVLFTGYLDRADIPHLLSGATAFVFPSRYEGFGMPPLEAMSCGAPVIACNVSAMPEVIGDAGLLVEPGDANALAEAMERLAGDEKLRAELKRKGIERAAGYTWDRSAEVLTGVIRELHNGSL